MYRMELALIMYLCKKHVHARFIRFLFFLLNSEKANLFIFR